MKSYLRYIAVGALCLTAAHSYAQPLFGGDRWHEHHKEFREEFEKKMEELNLTEDQKEKLQVLREKRKDLRERKKALWDDRKALWESMQDTTISEEQLLKRFHEISSQQQTLQEESFRGILARRAILTPEQFSKMAAFWKEKREASMKKHSEDDSDH